MNAKEYQPEHRRYLQVKQPHAVLFCSYGASSSHATSEKSLTKSDSTRLFQARKRNNFF